MATEKAKQWNDQWWTEVVHKKKTALPVLHNVRAKKSVPKTSPHNKDHA